MLIIIVVWEIHSDNDSLKSIRCGYNEASSPQVCNSKCESIDMHTGWNGSQWWTAGVEADSLTDSLQHGAHRVTAIKPFFLSAAAHTEQSTVMLSWFCLAPQTVSPQCFIWDWLWCSGYYIHNYSEQADLCGSIKVRQRKDWDEDYFLQLRCYPKTRWLKPKCTHPADMTCVCYTSSLSTTKFPASISSASGWGSGHTHC